MGTARAPASPADGHRRGDDLQPRLLVVPPGLADHLPLWRPPAPVAAGPVLAGEQIYAVIAETPYALRAPHP
ncbi:MAG TPA: hypothetical protein VMT03_26670 [Polyangia bacterium]|nr:hypothetical protein [Polyangia bacterium]